MAVSSMRHLLTEYRLILYEAFINKSEPCLQFFVLKTNQN